MLLQIEYLQSITNVEVCNIAEQWIMLKSVNAMMESIAMSGFAAGTYFVKVAADDAARIVKVIIK